MAGTLQAVSPDAARAALVSAGYTVRHVTELASPASSMGVPASNPVQARPIHSKPLSQVPPLRKAPAPQTQIHLSSKVEAPGPAPRLNTLPISDPPTDTIKTKIGSDKDLFILFSQLSSYFRSGINPVQAFHDLMRRTPKRFHESMKLAADTVAEGGRMSDAFAKYPYLYPPDVIGTVRAGEAAGFLPEAMDEIASKMDLSNRFKKKFKYFAWMFIATIALTPMVLGVVQGSIQTMAAQDSAGGSLPPVQTLGKFVGLSFLHNFPITTLIFASIWGFLAWFNSMPMRSFRHKLVIRLPIIGKRAMAESMARLTWAMGMISKGGMSPQNTFLLGTQAEPNLFVSHKLEEEGQRMGESDKLSSALRRSALLPPEYGNIVETGEVTGDVPRALEHVARATDADFHGRNATAAVSSGFILYGLLGVLILIVCAWLLTTLYSGEMKVALPDDF